MPVNAGLPAVWLPLVAAFVAGLALGFLFFGGLWLTVKQLATAKQPALLFVASFVLRTAAVVVGVYLIGAGQWQRIAACMAGFILMRALLTWRWGPKQAAKVQQSP